jgi:transposase
MPRIDIFEENRRLRVELEHERMLRKQLQKKYNSLEKKYKELEAKLNRILNINTPSSQVPFTEKDTNRSPNRQAKGTNPLGKPKGGNGGTRPTPKKVDRKEQATTHECDGCHSKDIKHVDTEKAYVWDFPVIKLIVTLFYVYIYTCNNCGKEVRGKHKDLPKSGMIGPNLAAFLIELRQKFAGSYGKLSEFLYELTDETFTRQTIKESIKRIASDLKPSYNAIREKLMAESYANIDETKWPVNGKHFYLWLFCSANYVYLTIRNSRARRVVISVLGDIFEGVIISDCLKVYNKCAVAFQKCWAHLLRKSYSLAQKSPRSDVRILHEQLTALYGEAEMFRKVKLDDYTRRCVYIVLKQKLQRLAEYKWKSTGAKNIVKDWLKEWEGHWLTGVMIPEVELTNNRSERKIRKVIPTRKMLGGHRTEEGADDFTVIESHRQTWKLQNKSPHLEMYGCLQKMNSGKEAKIA